MKQKLELQCPKCNATIDSSTQRAMSPFWAGVKPAICSNCSSLIQWHRSIRKRLLVGAHVFKLGILGVLISFLPVFSKLENNGFSFQVIGILLVLFGIFVTRTSIEKVKIELMNES